MRLLFVIILLVVTARGAICSVMPLTAKDVGLMLRSGYSSEAVMRELSVRHFVDVFGSEVEKQLVNAGADQALIEALRSGQYNLTPSEAAAAKEKRAIREERAALVAEQPEKHETPQQIRVAPARPTPPTTVGTPDAIYRLLKGDLVHWHQGSISHFDDEALEHKELYIFFFSANSSRPARKFTPQLLEYYNRVAPQHPEFEVIFFSADRSQFGMETCMGQSNMPWPAVGYEKLASKTASLNNLVRGIPCLILTDASGKVLSISSGGEKDPGPEKVLADLDQIFARGRDNAVGQAP